MEKANHVLSQLIKINNATIDLKDRLENTVFLVAGAFEVGFCAFFSLGATGDFFVMDAASNRSPAKSRSFRLEAKAAVFYQAIQRKGPLIIAEWLEDSQKAALQRLTAYEPRSLLGIPVGDDKVVYGALVLLHDRPRVWLPEEVDLLTSVGQEMAGALRNAQVLVSSKKRIAELTALFEVEQVLGTTLELEKLLRSVVSIIARVMDADGCRICLRDKSRASELRPVVNYGHLPDNCGEPVLSRSCPQELVTYGQPGTGISADVVSDKGEATTIIAPLSVKSQVMGSLCLYREKPEDGQKKRGFGPEDVRLVSTMGSMIAKSLENALIHGDVEALARENENMVRELSTLYEISGDLMTTVSVEEIGKILMRAITSDEGLGFDRAVMFLIDEQEQVLKEAGRKGGEGPAEELVIPLHESGGVLSRAVREKMAVNLEPAAADSVVSRIWAEGSAGVGQSIVPLIAKDKIMGVIVVDNFRTERAITAGNLLVLSMLASHAGLALDNARLYGFLDKTSRELVEARELLAEAEKMAAMGEMASTLAHEIRNPLVSVGGLARRAIKVVNGDSAGKRYLEVIVDEVGRLEKTLNELLDYVHEPEQAYAEHDLVQIMDECLQLMDREFKEAGIVINKNLEPLPPLWCDERQIKHTLFNLLLNALQAMPSGGTLWISSSVEKEDADLHAICAVKDTGGGIPEDILHNIFNPFFTTKRQGSGLGLPISYRIISRHGGKIEVENEPGKGVAFIVKVPLNPERRAHRLIRGK